MFPGSSLMCSNDGQHDTLRSHPSTTGVRWISQSPSQRPPCDPTLLLQSHVTPYFTFGALQPASLPWRTSEPTLPPTFPSQTPSRPLHTHHNYFPGQYTMPSRLPFHNQPAQSCLHDGYGPSGSSSYPPTGYYPLPLHPPLPYFGNEASIQSSSSYHQTQHPHTLMPQFTAILPGPFHAASSGRAQQYLSPSYSSTAYTGSPQQSQRNMHHRHHNPGSRNTFPTRAQQHPFSYSQSGPQHSCRDSNTITVQSMGSERLPSPNQGASGGPLVTASRNAVSPITTIEPPGQISAQCLSKLDIHEPSPKLTTVTAHTNDCPLVRRRHHPNLPPNRSEWVMWVGNVPSGANHDELWQFLSSSNLLSSGSSDSGRVGDSGLVSLFLISRSNCAFVNYHSQEQLNHAINQFNGHQLRPDDPRCPRLVCRARRRDDDLRAGVGAQRGVGMHTRHIKGPSNKNELSSDALTLTRGRRSRTARSMQAPLLPLPRDGGTPKLDTLEGTSPKFPTHSPSSYASTTSSFLIRNFPKRFFILKSLTQVRLLFPLRR